MGGRDGGRRGGGRVSDAAGGLGGQAVTEISWNKLHLSSRPAVASLNQLCDDLSQHLHIALAHLAHIDCGLCYEVRLP